MFDKVKGIAVKGGFFGEESKSLGTILSSRMNIVFGRNGSGKSTIAKAFTEQKKEEGNRNYSVRFCGESPLPDIGGSNIFVFDEDFIDRNVKIDMIRSIVMLGKDIQLDDELKAAKEELDRLKDDSEIKNKDASRLSEKAKELKEKIEENLRRGYVARLERVEGGTKRLSPKIFEKVTTLKAADETKSLGDYAKDLDKSIVEYRNCLKGETVDTISDVTFPDISRVNALLAKTVKPAALSEEENRILSILSGELAGGHFLENAQSMIIDAERDFCPLCQQGISHDHRKVLASRLLRFKDKQVEDFKAEIADEKDRINPVSIRIPEGADGIDSTVSEALSKAVDGLNEFVKNTVTALEDKLGNPYAPAEGVDESVFSGLCASVTAAVKTVNDKISEYNEKISNFKTLRSEIDNMNTELAFLESKSYIIEYNKTSRECTAAQEKAEKLTIRIAEKKEEIQRMQAHTAEIGTAMENINQYLRVIFGKDRLVLKNADNNGYSILSRGREISPRSLSIGERNAIALAYFFACVVEGKENDYKYSDPTLLILDDPVSSFDLENKAGMISLIGKQCSKILKGCVHSKVLVLTHDFMTLRDLNVIREKIFKSLRNTRTDETEKYCLLQNGVLQERETSSIRENNDYLSRMQNIFYYGKDGHPEDNPFDSNMGSIIRRLLEQYASFRYQKPWFELFSDEMLEGIDKSKKEAIQDLYMRPVLNPESHGTDEVYQSSEIQRVARMVLAYLYLTDKPHLTSYIRDNYKLNLIKQWAEEL